MQEWVFRCPVAGGGLQSWQRFSGDGAASGQFLHGIYHVVTPGFFSALGMRVRQGRTFTPQDDRKTPLVAVVNESYVRQGFWKHDAVRPSN